MAFRAIHMKVRNTVGAANDLRLLRRIPGVALVAVPQKMLRFVLRKFLGHNTKSLPPEYSTVKLRDDVWRDPAFKGFDDVFGGQGGHGIASFFGGRSNVRGQNDIFELG